MESSFQKIIAAIVGVLILFIVPVYMAFEKVDDIAYGLVLKHTQAFVDNVREKGYISPDMYADFLSDIYSTNNSYDIQVEHIKKRFDPVIYIYDNKGVPLYTLDYDMYIEQYNAGQINVNGIIYQTSDLNYSIALGHSINEERITDKQITNKLFRGTTLDKSHFLLDYMAGNIDLYNSLVYIDENSYIMNEGDKVNVTIKNSNKTMASTLYSMLTANVNDTDASKIYVEYGGSIKNSGSVMLEASSGSINSNEGKLFKYKGKHEEVMLDEGTYEIQCWGASGGGNVLESGAYTGGLGAYAKTKIDVDEETTVYVYVGGEGESYDMNSTANGGWNGGGNSYLGYGGGGASDVRLVADDDTDEVLHEKSLMTRIIVAAGGGGASSNNGLGGHAGRNGKDGAVASGDNKYVGKGAVFSLENTIIKNGLPEEYDKATDKATGTLNIFEYENGTLGTGGKADYLGAGAGGAGFVGGSASHNQNGGGGGGSSYIYNNNLTALEKIYSNILSLQLIYNNINVTDAEIKDGNTVMPNPLPFNGVLEKNGNKGNGWIIIKKLS